ncbi:hypothetical protein AYI70_g6550 [Smittium culicis]|uniref:Uncharacterized protein n=1 Tax=Smittium culicis TaxID=133412 RepID=A0A1R1XPE5_9FUNG|nr:hypothetical protein AYI70_g6550 [Smittium culicis]
MDEEATTLRQANLLLETWCDYFGFSTVQLSDSLKNDEFSFKSVMEASKKLYTECPRKFTDLRSLEDALEASLEVAGELYFLPALDPRAFRLSIALTSLDSDWLMFGSAEEWASCLSSLMESSFAFKDSKDFDTLQKFISSTIDQYSLILPQ